MATISLTKLISFAIIIILVIIATIFARHMNSFNKALNESSKKNICQENDKIKITTEEECYNRYNGRLVLGQFDNVGVTKVCCLVS